jgi:hypothetical protein
VFNLGAQEIILLLVLGAGCVGVPLLAVVIVLAVVFAARGRRPADEPESEGRP